MDEKMRSSKYLVNCDLGEKDNTDELSLDLKLLPYIDMANIACAGHAGSHDVMQFMMDACKQNNVHIGAHPSYPDRKNFGRISIPADGDKIRTWISQQLNLFLKIAAETGVTIHHMKPHGALYHDTAQLDVIAAMVVDVTQELMGSVAIVGPAGTALEAATIRVGLPYLAEAFADRRYTPSLALQSRTIPGSVLSPAQASDQIHQMITHGTVTTSDGPRPIRFDTLCIHSDSPDALTITRSLHNLTRS